MKIVNIILTSQNGGAEQAFIDYTIALKNLGHEVLAILKTDAPYADRLQELDVKVTTTNNKFGYHDFFAIRNIKKILEEFDADLVISHIGRATVLTRRAIKKIKQKKVLQIAVNHSDNIKRSIGCDIVLSVNKTIFFRTVKLGQKEDRSFVISNAIDLSDAPEILLKNNFQKKEKIVIGAIGRLDRSKGFEHAIKALINLEKKSQEQNLHKEFILKLAGSGYFEPNLRQLVKELNLENKVEFLGWIKNKKEFFESVDIFCLPSENEPFGIVLLEAMKYGKPIIASDADGPKEILRHEIDALLVNLNPRENLDERISQAVMQIINQPELADELIANSARKLREKFSYQALQDNLQEIVGKVK